MGWDMVDRTMVGIIGVGMVDLEGMVVMAGGMAGGMVGVMEGVMEGGMEDLVDMEDGMVVEDGMAVVVVVDTEGMEGMDIDRDGDRDLINHDLIRGLHFWVYIWD